MSVAASMSFAHSAQSGDIMIGHVWAYPTNTSATANKAFGGTPGDAFVDVYGPFLNRGSVLDALVNVTGPAVGSARLVMWIRGSQIIGALPLSLMPGKPVALAPQSQFLRLYGSRRTLKVGDTFPITLHFRHAPDVTMDVVVQAALGGQ
jgi:copper(I)-binding protein